MNRKELYQHLQAAGLTERQQQNIAAEMDDCGDHSVPVLRAQPITLNDLYGPNDLSCLQDMRLNDTSSAGTASAFLPSNGMPSSSGESADKQALGKIISTANRATQWRTSIMGEILTAR